MIYYEKYEYKDGIYVGVGELIEEEIEEFLEGPHIGKRGNYKGPQIFVLSGGEMNVSEESYLYKNTLYDFLVNLSEGQLNPQWISKASGMFGPLGRDSFRKVENGYYCNSFNFEEEWFKTEAEKLRNLRIAFYELYGAEQRNSDLSTIKIIFKNSEDEKEFNEKMSNLDNIQQFEYFSEIIKKNELKIKEKIPHRHTPKKNINIAKNIFFDRLNECMINVRPLHNWDSDRNQIKVTYQPLNIFGFAALKILDSHQKKMNYYFCKECNELNYMKRSGSHICPTCRNRMKQRRKNIRTDFSEGLSLEDVIKKRKSATREEIEKIYLEFKKKESI